MRPVDVFADYLNTLHHGGTQGAAIDYIADGILSDPQAHIDALVEAGVLRRGTSRAYYVVAPERLHVHEWKVSAWTPVLDNDVSLMCVGCGGVRWVANRLPIEVPE